MIVAPLPHNEAERLDALDEYNILDTLPEQEFDDITQIASYICGMPISLVTLLDKNRQWFKSKHGLDVDETPREQAFCGYTILNNVQIFVVPDSSKDERFADNPLVTGGPNVAFYAGVPLVNPKGHVLGALCVIDNKPNEINEEQIKVLKSLGRQVVALLELRKAITRNDEIKKTISNIVSLSKSLLDQGSINPANSEQFNSIIMLADRLSGLLN